MSRKYDHFAVVMGRLVVSFALLLGSALACQSTTGVLDAAAVRAAQSETDALNNRIATAAAVSRGSGAGDYRVGPGDVLEIDVFQAEELSRTLRVRPDGTLSFPLLGSIQVAGQTTNELEESLAERLSADYLWDPQVSVFVKDFRAHPVSVVGEVHEPGVFYLQEPRSLVEMLAEAGGLTEEAATTVRLRRRRTVPGSTEPDFELLSIDLHSHLSEGGPGPDLEVMSGDTIYVAKAGVVFLEGAVERPGVYPLQGNATVLKGIAMAGGLVFAASSSSIQLIRRGESGPVIFDLDMGEIKKSPSKDVALRDGDVVVIGKSPVKVGFATLWRAIAGLMSLSMGL